MSSLALWAFVFEIFVLCFLVWGISHEAELIAFENKIAERIRRK